MIQKHNHDCMCIFIFVNDWCSYRWEILSNQEDKRVIFLLFSQLSQYIFFFHLQFSQQASTSHVSFWLLFLYAFICVFYDCWNEIGDCSSSLVPGWSGFILVVFKLFLPALALIYLSSPIMIEPSFYLFFYLVFCDGSLFSCWFSLVLLKDTRQRLWF